MRGLPHTIQDFSGGINLADNPMSFAFQQAYDLSNVEPSGRAGLHRREAGLNYHAGLVGPGNLYWSNKFSRVFWSRTSGSTATIYIDGTSIASGLDVNPWQFCDAPQSGTPGTTFLYAVNGGTGGVSNPQVFNGTVCVPWVATSGTVPPQGKFPVYMDNRFLLAAINTVYASALQDPKNWSTATGNGWTATFDADEASSITGMCQCGPYLIVFKEHSVYVVYDLDTGAHRRLGRSVGATLGVSNGALPCVSAGNSAYFVTTSQGGHGEVWVTDGTTVSKVSDAVGQSMSSITGLAYSAPYLLVTTQDTYTWVYDEHLRSWWRHTLGTSYGPTTVMSAPAIAGNASAGMFLLFIGNTDILTWAPRHGDYQAATPQDATAVPTTITGQWTSGRGTFSRNRNASQHKRLRAINLQGNHGLPGDTVDLSVYSNDLTYASFYSTPATRLGLTLPTEVYNFGTGRSFAVKVSGTGQWLLDNMTLGYQYRQA